MGLLSSLFGKRGRETAQARQVIQAEPNDSECESIGRFKDASTDAKRETSRQSGKFVPMEYGKVGEGTLRVRELIEDVTKLGCREDIGISEVKTLIERLDADFGDSDDVFVNAAKALLLQIADDGAVSEDERRLLAGFGEMYANPISDEPVKAVAGKAFVLTGDFEIDGGKATAAEMIKAAGGEVKSGTSRKVSYVVVGGLGSDAWAFGGFGQKVKKALDLTLTGKADIRVVTEKALMAFFAQSSPEAMDALNERAERFERQWKSVRVVSRDFEGLTGGQREVFDLVRAGRNVCLTGLGGTGKSYVLDRIIEWARGEEMNVIVCAPTGIAALNIGGCTVHRALGIRPGKTLQMNPHPYVEDGSALLECDLMIVDEISMCRMDLFDYLSSVLKKAAAMRAEDGKRPCQLIVVGDFCQLPPVVTKDEKDILDQKYGFDVRNGYPFMGTDWDSWCFEKVELTEAIRQRDADFVAALNACRVGDTSGLHWIEEHAAGEPAEKAIVLCGRNDDAARENRKRLDALPGESFAYMAVVSGSVEESDMPAEKALKLKAGARVMALVNDTEGAFMNGSLGDVVRCGDDCVEVRFDNGYVGVLCPHEWDILRPTLDGRKMRMETIGTFTQIPLKLAYALTIHKAQGQTFEAASIYPRCWDPGQLYTALSRLTSISGLHMAHSCPDSSLITSPDVIDFNEGKPISKQYLSVVEQVGSQAELPISETTKSDEDEPSEEPAPKPSQGRKQHAWTAEEEGFIMANPDMTARELAERFGVTAKAVERKRAKLRSSAQR